jgi:DNA repair exonuclease SbcCD ATPase subunit
MDSGGEWCTYVQAAQRLHKSHGAIRQMALRGQLQRVRGNDGKARVLILPDMERAAHVQAEQMDERPESVLSVQPERAEHVQRTDGALTHALESHIKTLQADNEALKQDLTTTRADLSAHVETLKGELETLKGQLVGAEAMAGEEAAKTAQAIAAFQSLAERLEAIAEARRPWWRRLVG